MARNPPMACGPCDFVAGALSLVAQGSGRSCATRRAALTGGGVSRAVGSVPNTCS